MKPSHALLISWFALSTCALAASDARIESPVIPRIDFEKYTLQNGLEVILVKDDRLPMVTVNIWYHVGAANESRGLTGFAHLFEHMMFAASKHVPRGAADRLLEAAGGTNSNGSTSFDRTNYLDTVPSNQLELALWTHADRMGYLLDVLDQAALANQQDVVRNERRENIENQPYGIVEEALFHNLFPVAHPYHADIMGSHADIQSAKLDDIRRFFKTYYRPNNATLVVAGDIDRKVTKKLVEKYFGSFKRGPDVPKVDAALPPITEERRVVVQDRVELPRVIMGWLTTPAYQPGDIALSLAAQILGGGKSSRLYQKLVYEKQIAQDAVAYQQSLGLTSIFVIEVTARPGHSAEEIEAAIDGELNGLRAAPLDAGEVERARNTIETQLVGQLEKIGGLGGLADALNRYNHYTGDPGFVAQEFALYRDTDASMIQQAIQQQLRPSARVVVYGVPGTPDLGPDVPAQAKDGHAEAGESINADEPWRARPPRPGKPRALKLARADTFTLDNGLVVIHQQKAGLPLVTAQLVVRSGADANPAARPGLASFVAEMLDEGTTTRSSIEIANEAARLGTSLSSVAGADASFVSVGALKKNFAAALDLMSDIALHPAFPADEVERRRASRLGELAQTREDPDAAASIATAAAMYGRENPFGFPDLGTEAAIRETSRDDLVAYWRAHFVPNNAALVLVGDLSPSEARSLAAARFGDWKPGQSPAAAGAGPRPTRARLVLVDMPGKPQTAIRVALPGVARKSPEFPTLQVLNAGLGGLFTSRLNTSLREEKGYAYGAFSRFIYHRQPGVFIAEADVRTDATAPSVAEILRQIRGIGTMPFSTEELTRARDSQLLSMPARFETNDAIAGNLANTYVYGLGLDYYLGLPAQFRTVRGPQLQAAAQKYLKANQAVVIAVGDAAAIRTGLEQLGLGAIEYRDADGNVLPQRQAERP